MIINNIIDRIKKSKTNILLVLGCVGILLIYFSKYIPANADYKSTSPKDEAIFTSEELYKGEIINSLKDILSKVEGVGTIEIMLTFSEGYTYEYATENKKNSDTVEDVSETARTRKQDRKTNEEKYVIIDKGGHKSPLIKRVVNPQIKGVIIVCDGGSDPKVINRIIEATSVSLGILSSQVSVLPMKTIK